MSEVVISVEHLTKEYRIGAITHRTFQRDLQSWWARVRGRDDPNLPVDGGRRKKLEQFADENGIIHALKDVSFEVKQGEVLGIIGKNGAGKSTLLKILSRVTAPTSGCVKITGRIGSLLEVGTGFHPELTGRENIYMNGAILGMKKREIDRKLDEIIDFSGVEQFIDTPVKRYSSGMYVRLAFAVAAHLDPEILVVDEVLAVGDAEFQKKCLGKMDDVSKKEGRTVLFVSHNLYAINSICNGALMLASGLLRLKGKTSQVLSDYIVGDVSGRLLPPSRTIDVESAKGAAKRNIVSLELRGTEGVVKNIFYMGEPIIIKVSFDSFRFAAEKNKIAVKMKNSAGVGIINCDSNDFNVNLKEGCSVTLEIGDVFLYPDTYSLNVWISSVANNSPYLFIQDALQFEVIHDEEKSGFRRPLLTSDAIIYTRQKWLVVEN